MKQGEVAGTSIGKQVHIKGEITGLEDLYLDGDVEGSISLGESRLTLGPGARVRANIAARDVIVLGRLDGHIKATGRVELHQSAVMNGDIVATRLSIDDGSLFKGRVELSQGGLANAAGAGTAVSQAGSNAPPAQPAREPLVRPATIIPPRQG